MGVGGCSGFLLCWDGRRLGVLLCFAFARVLEGEGGGGVVARGFSKHGAAALRVAVRRPAGLLLRQLHRVGLGLRGKRIDLGQGGLRERRDLSFFYFFGLMFCCGKC